MDSIVQADNCFAFRLFHALDRDGGQNTLISPSSIAFALAMTYNGAGGQTQKAMQHALGLDGLTLAEVNEGNAALRSAIVQPARGVELSDGNAIWVNRRYAFDPDFVERVHTFYGGEAAALDFRDPASAEHINGWVAQATHDKITRMITASELAKSDAVLMNAVYFRGAWKTPFDRAHTHEAPFHGPGGDTTVPMMADEVTAPYAEVGGVQLASLPYGDGAASMVIALPASESSLAALLAKLDEKTWAGWLRALRDTRVDLSLPRFKLEYEAELVPPLASLGMAEAFGLDADFGPMGLSGSFISNVKHKAVMEVNEEGTEAAAATAVMMARGISRNPRMVVDRPFFCAIRDNRTGAILFMGAVNDPE